MVVTEKGNLVPTELFICPRAFQQDRCEERRSRPYQPFYPQELDRLKFSEILNRRCPPDKECRYQTSNARQKADQGSNRQTQSLLNMLESENSKKPEIPF